MPITIGDRFELDAFELDEPEDAGRVRKSIKSAKDLVRFPFPTKSHRTLLTVHCIQRQTESPISILPNRQRESPFTYCALLVGFGMLSVQLLFTRLAYDGLL
ncbi:hypothetical protein JHK87_052577 [Glycine soja]|nr:hypothetical protein JHK87_052577 [Glycine soja]